LKSLSILVICSVLFSNTLFAREGDTTIVNFYTKYDVQQYLGPQWHKSFKEIDPKKKYKKAILKIDLGCASYGCCAWDYTFRGYFGKKKAGIDSAILTSDSPKTYRYYPNSENWEVARLITPYSSYMRLGTNGYNSNWSHPYTFDVTDFLPLLKDSICFAAHTGGWDNKGKFGFSISVNLILIEGKAEAIPIKVEKIYEDGYVYKSKNEFDSITKSHKFFVNKENPFVKFKSIISGHDAQGEFTPIDYYIKLNGVEIFKKRLWKENCDKTYIQPQSGTWIFSRTNWCPGEKIIEEEIDLSPFLKKNDSNEVDISFGYFPPKTDSPYHANYVIAGYLIYYESIIMNDVALDAIIAPNSDPNFKIDNAICLNPKIRIKNIGQKAAKELYIDYWVDAKNKQTYIWRGEIKNSEIKEIELPQMSWKGTDTKSPIFYCSIQKNQYNSSFWNDLLASKFNLVDQLPSEKIILEFKSSSGEQKNKNKIKLVNASNQVVFEKEYFGDSKTYLDTIQVPKNCYKLTLIDSNSEYECGDGLSFWFSNHKPISKDSFGYGNTPGSFRILNAKDQSELKKFNPDFGGLIMYQFSTHSLFDENLNEIKNKYILQNQALKKIYNKRKQ
jgi:hypothetical protein